MTLILSIAVALLLLACSLLGVAWTDAERENKSLLADNNALRATVAEYQEMEQEITDAIDRRLST